MSKLTIDEYLKEAFKRNKSNQTHPEVHKRAVELIRRCWAEDVFIVFTDGLRTMEDQAVIYGKGRASFIYNGKQYGNPKVSRVSNAKPGDSMHNYALALDFVTCDGYGKNIDWVVGQKWKRAAAIAKGLGFVWGGDWKSFYDAPHIEYNGGLTISQIAKGKRPVFKTFTPIQLTKEKEETKVYSSPTLKAEHETTRSSAARRKIIVEAAVAAGYNKLWLDKLKNGTITADDVDALAAGTLIKMHK